MWQDKWENGWKSFNGVTCPTAINIVHSTLYYYDVFEFNKVSSFVEFINLFLNIAINVSTPLNDIESTRLPLHDLT